MQQHRAPAGDGRRGPLLNRYKDRPGQLTHYEQADTVPIAGVVRADWHGHGEVGWLVFRLVEAADV